MASAAEKASLKAVLFCTIYLSIVCEKSLPLCMICSKLNIQSNEAKNQGVNHSIQGKQMKLHGVEMLSERIRE